MNIIEALNAASMPPARIAENIWEQAYLFDAGFLGFKGHFPGNPVLPAFIQLLMLRLLYSQVVRPASYLPVKTAKFFAPIGPDLPLILRMEGTKATLIAGNKNMAVIKFRP